jgi:hypothetical protein
MKSGTEHHGLDYILSNDSSENIQKTYSGHGVPKSEYEGSRRELFPSEEDSEIYKLGVHEFPSIILGQALHTLGFPVIPEFPIKSMQGNKKGPGKKNWKQIIRSADEPDLAGGVVCQQRISPLEDSLKLHNLSQEELEETYGISSLDEKAFIPIPVEFGYTPESLDDISKHFFEYDKRSRIARAERIVDVFSGLNPVDALFGELRIQNCGTEDGELRVFDFGSELGREPHRMHPIKYDNDGTPIRGLNVGYILDLESDTPEAKDARLWYFKMMNLGWIKDGEIEKVGDAVNGIDVKQFSLAFENQEIKGKINDFKDSHREHLKILKYFGGKFNGASDELEQELVNQLAQDGYFPIRTVPNSQAFYEAVGADFRVDGCLISHGDESRPVPELVGVVWLDDLEDILNENKTSEVNSSGIPEYSLENLFCNLLLGREAHLPTQGYFYDNGPGAVRLLSHIAAKLRHPELNIQEKENPANSYIHEFFANVMRMVNLETDIIDMNNARRSLCDKILIQGLQGNQNNANSYISELNALDDTIVALMTGTFENLRKEIESNNYESFDALLGEITLHGATETDFVKFDSFEEFLKQPVFEWNTGAREAQYNFDDDKTRAQRINVTRIVSDLSPEAVRLLLCKL